MSAREMRRKTDTHTAHSNAQAHAADTDTAAVRAITMIQTCPWETV